MSVTLNPNNDHSSFLNFIQQFRSPIKTFHHRSDGLNPELFIDLIEGRPGFYLMTAQGPQIRPGEVIEVEQYGQYQAYQVDKIESYGEPSDMWRAVIHKNS